MNILHRARKKITDSYWVWKFIKNREARMLYKANKRALTPIQQKLLEDLNLNGIATAHVKDLFPDQTVYRQLEDSIRRMEESRKPEIEEARKHADEISVKKDFLLQLLGDKPQLDANDVNVKFALQEEILDVVNAYFGCLTKLKFFNVWHTFVTHSGPKRSMLWHKDPEDKWIIKVFLYLNDVGEGGGPFVYAPGTHPKGNVKQKPEWFKEPGRGAERSTDEQMAKVVSPEKWIKALGKKGTIIFADTKGYHKGGFASTDERIMYNCLFVSPASTTSEVFERDMSSDLSKLSISIPQKFALVKS
jgi:hypothetical protein